MARWGSGDDTRWESDRDRGRWGEDRNAGRWGDERNAGRWRGEDERYLGRDEGAWRERSSGWRDDDWRSRERGDAWRSGESRGGEEWRGREGRWEDLRPGERRTYRSGGEEGRGEGRGLFGRIRDEGREMFGRPGDGGRFDRDRDEDWRSEGWRNEGRSGSEDRGYGGMMGGPYGTGRSEWRGRDESRYGRSGEYGGYGRAGEYGGYGSEYGLGSDLGRNEPGRYESGRGEWRESREEHGGGMMDRLKEGMRKLTGKGPKGYRRSDERIREDVSERIARSAIDADEVEVKVENGEVTLSGTVNSREDKRRLEDLAEDVFGVDEVHNALRVNRGGAMRAGAIGTQPSGLIGTGQPATGGGPSTGTGTSPQPTQVRTGPSGPVEPGKTAH